MLYWVLPSFIRLFWVLLGFTGFYWVYRVLLGYSGFYWVSLGFTGFYWVLPSFIRLFWVLLGFTGFYWVLLGFTGLYLVFVSVFTEFGWVELDDVEFLPSFTGFFLGLSACLFFFLLWPDAFRAFRLVYCFLFFFGESGSLAGHVRPSSNEDVERRRDADWGAGGRRPGKPPGDAAGAATFFFIGFAFFFHGTSLCLLLFSFTEFYRVLPSFTEFFVLRCGVDGATLPSKLPNGTR